MNVIFYISAAVAVMSTIMVITCFNAVHALLYLVVSLLAVAMVFYTLGAPFVAALEVIIYAGAIVVLLVFVVMMLNQGAEAIEQERSWQNPRLWIGPGILSAILFGELAFVLMGPMGPMGLTESGPMGPIAPKAVALSLFGPYVVGVEMASLLLLAGLVGAFHLGRRDDSAKGEEGDN